jgi:Na+-driven multidrug efflux pump
MMLASYSQLADFQKIEITNCNEFVYNFEKLLYVIARIDCRFDSILKILTPQFFEPLNRTITNLIDQVMVALLS